MLTITDDDLHNCLVLEPTGALTRRDLDLLTERFNARVSAGGRVPNLVVRAASFPTWADLAALMKHFRFIRQHHRLVGRVAIVSDARALDLAPRLARHFVSAEVRHFPADGFEVALEWVAGSTEDAGQVSVMPDLPDDVLGLSVEGVIGAADYAETIAPLIEAKRQRHSRVKLLYRLGPRFEALTPGAVWSDAQVGASQLAGFSKVAVVSDAPWIRHAMRALAPLIAAETQVFPETRLAEAKAWIAE